VPVSEYRKQVDKVVLFLEGRSRELASQLAEEMAEAAEHLEYEKAARIRDQMRAVEKTVERQHVVSARMEDQDVIGVRRSAERVQVVILFVRKGCLVGARDYLLRDAGSSEVEATEAFIKQFYAREAFIPAQILVSEPVADAESLAAWISDLAGRKATILRPVRGEKRRLVELAVANAENLISQVRQGPGDDLMEMVQTVFDLDKRPRVIEGLDISNLQGGNAVGSVAVFVDGLPHRAAYRNYIIRGVEGIDDYGMMGELVERRAAKGQLPDLFLVDGGKGHLSAAWAALNRALQPARGAGNDGPDLPAVVAIAKPDAEHNESHEKCYVPGRKNPVPFGRDHPVLLLLMRIRDEAHRRAVTHHRKLRSKEITESRLDQIRGLGQKRKRALLAHFKDLDAVAGAGADELASVPGIDLALARRIAAHFRDTEAAEGARSRPVPKSS